MESNNIEDIRKKRYSREVVESSNSKNDEKSKKSRARTLKTDNGLEVTDDSNYKSCCSDSNDDIGSDKVPQKSEKVPQDVDDREGNQQPEYDDIESALQQVVQISDGIKEYVSDNAWISFRVGHAGDASLLATCIRKSINEKKICNENKAQPDGKKSSNFSSEDTSLEVRLAEGLGDEDTPPSIFALLVDVNKTDEEPHLGAAALFATTAEKQSQLLIVDWMYVDDQLEDIAAIIERRLWLRLCTLSVLSSCDKIVSKKKLESV
jgi:hypothetical protein